MSTLRRRSLRALAAAVGIAALTAVLAPVASAAPASPDRHGPGHGSGGHCDRIDRTRVPLAEVQRSACLDDLTTAGTVASGHTDPADWAGLHPAGAVNPSGVPGIQIDGHFRDDSTSNTNHGWNHDSQFVLRLPDRWNGGLVVVGAPGVREQYGNDFVIADHVLAQGYAFASTDKGNTGPNFFADGRRPGDAIVEWHTRVTQLAIAAKATLAQRYGRAPRRSIVAGISNGGYLVRWQLENNAWLWDAGVDWEGVLWTTDGPNLLTNLPPAMRGWQRLAAGDQGGRDEILSAGFTPQSEFLWGFHYQYYWDFTQRTYREEVDPAWDGDLVAGVPFCASGTPSCDADYDYASRPRDVRRAVQRIALDGRIGKPLITIHGDLDSLLPISDSDAYARMIRDAGRGHLHRYYRFEGGNHVDGLFAAYPQVIRPLLPCFTESFDATARWLAGRRPPPSATLPRPASGDLANECSLAA